MTLEVKSSERQCEIMYRNKYTAVAWVIVNGVQPLHVSIYTEITVFILMESEEKQAQAITRSTTKHIRPFLDAG